MKIFGLFGEKLSHSLSPKIHNMLYQALGIDAAYSLYEIQPQMLKDAVQGIRALSITGVNVTIPYKVSIMDYLDDISDESRRIGAVNTIKNNDNILTGFNTDYVGFGRMLDKNRIEVKNRTAVILGTGGAAKSVVTYLEDNNISNIYIVSREPDKVKAFDSTKYKLLDYTELENLEHVNILVNCTPCGMYPKIDFAPIDEAIVLKFNTVIDLIYNPTETLLLKYAKRNAIPAINGLYMLVAQAAASLEIWNEHSIDERIIEHVFANLKQAFEK